MGVALRGVGLVAGAEELYFSLIRLGYFLSVLAYMLAICWTLVWWPILDTRRAEWKAECMWQAVREEEEEAAAAEGGTGMSRGGWGEGDAEGRGGSPPTGATTPPVRLRQAFYLEEPTPGEIAGAEGRPPFSPS